MITPLAEAADPLVFGRKAVALGTAARAGLPVPAGVALSVDAVEAVVRADPEVVPVLHQVCASGGPRAVGSSAVREDSAGADRVGPRPIAVVGLSSSGRLTLPLALLGLGVGLATPAAQSASLAAVPGARSGAAAGIGSTMRYLGGVVGVALLGRLVHLDGDRTAVLGEHRTVLAVFAAALVAGLACAFALPRRSASRDPVPDDPVRDVS